LSLVLHGDYPDGPEYLELKVGIVGDGHELDVAWPSQDDVIRLEEINHFEHEHFGSIVACVSEGDWQGAGGP
jgi:hypothetical protein